MLKQITEKEALTMYVEGKDVKILAPRFSDRVCPDWEQYDTGMLGSLLNGFIYLADEETRTEDAPAVEEKQPAPDPDPEEPEVQKTKNKVGVKLNLDNGKIRALHKAGWTNEKIAEEMGTSGVTIGSRIRKMKESGEL